MLWETIYIKEANIYRQGQKSVLKNIGLTQYKCINGHQIHNFKAAFISTVKATSRKFSIWNNCQNIACTFYK